MIFIKTTHLPIFEYGKCFSQNNSIVENKYPYTIWSIIVSFVARSFTIFFQVSILKWNILMNSFIILSILTKIKLIASMQKLVYLFNIRFKYKW